MIAKHHFNQPPAIVVGVCGHGLSLIHALAEGRIPVIALEANRQLPGTRTKHAHIEHVTEINGIGLITSLQNLAQRLECPGKPVLFLTNDRMTTTVATHWESLDPFYHLSWAHCRENIVTLLDKKNLETRCLKQGLNYPPTCLINSESDIDSAIAITGNSAIIKPSKPLAGFKTALPRQRQDYCRLIKQCESDLPFITQKFIPGDDTCIYFCALYLDRGRVLARFDGRKLRSRPMGHSTIAESCINEDVYQLTLRFFEGLQVSGPVSMEFKKDAEGRYWVIEPTIGRTDFWLGLCTTNKINLPLTEYRNQLNQPDEPMVQSNIAVWFNEERDPLGQLWLAFHPTEKLGNRRATYLFLHQHDLLPGLLFALMFIKGLFFRSLSRLRKEVTWTTRLLSNHTAKLLWKKTTNTFQRMESTEGCIYFLSIVLKKLTCGHALLIRYHFVAQPVPTIERARMRPDKKAVIELISRDHPLVSLFPRPANVIQKRFDDGHLCFVAKMGEKFSGFLWIAKNQYEEDEVRCCYRLLYPEESAWDFDVYVEPEYRYGRTLARLWDCANNHMALEGKKWSFSRIAASNTESLRSHAHLGTLRMFAATFLCVGKVQISAIGVYPFFHVSLSKKTGPTLILEPPLKCSVEANNLG